MRGTDVDNVGVTPDTVFQRIEVGSAGCLAFLEQSSQFAHCGCVTLRVVKRKVADLYIKMVCERINITEVDVP